MSAQLDHAISFATTALSGRTDASGLPEILHSLAVLAGMPLESTDEERIAAVLHDVVEDTDTTLGDIEMIFGFPVRHLVDGVTRRNSESYAEFIDRAALDPGTRKIKRADLNANLARSFPEEDRVRFRSLHRRYRQALLTLYEPE